MHPIAYCSFNTSGTILSPSLCIFFILSYFFRYGVDCGNIFARITPLYRWYLYTTTVTKRIPYLIYVRRIA